MRFSAFMPLVGTAWAVSCKNYTLWLCGDSTMAHGGGHNGTEGWGQYLQYSFDSHVQVTLGDWVVIQFGHNDAGIPANDTKYRTDCPSIGSETCPAAYDNQTEIVQTYTTYLRNATSRFLSLGARVIIASPTPTNPFTSAGIFSWSPTIYTYYCRYIASSLGGPANGVYYIDHSDYAAQAVQLAGAEVTNKNFPMDNTHLSPYFADVFAHAFVLGLKCGTAPLQKYVTNATARIEGDVLGVCLGVNGTLPV